MSATSHWARRTLRLVLLGAGAGAITSLASVFTVLALSGRGGAVGVPIVWGLAAMIGVVFGGVILPVLGLWLLREVPLRRVIVIVGAAMWVGSAAISVIGNGGLGAIAGIVAAVGWLRYLEPALGPGTAARARG